MPNWYAAKTSGRETRATFYLDRAEVKCYRPEVHNYFIDKRTGAEKSRASSLFPGYIFFSPESPDQFSAAKNAIGIGYILGGWHGNEFIPRSMPAGWVDALIGVGPVVRGRKKRFCNGEKVRVIISGLSEILATVESQTKGKVTVKAVMFGSEMEFTVDESKVELSAA